MTEFCISPAPLGPVRVQSEELDPAVGQLVEDVCLTFDCDLSNVLVVVIHWRVRASQLTSAISCTVDMLDQVCVCSYSSYMSILLHCIILL